MLIGALDPNVVLTSDGGGGVAAARRPVVGDDHVARFLTRMPPNTRVAAIAVNGRLGGSVCSTGDTLSAAVSVTLEGARVTRLDLVRSPHKLPQRTLHRDHVPHQ